MDIVGLTDLASDIGALGISILVIWALLSDRLVTKGRLDEMRDERDALQAKWDHREDVVEITHALDHRRENDK